MIFWACGTETRCFYLVQINTTRLDMMLRNVVDQRVPKHLYLQHRGSAVPSYPLEVQKPPSRSRWSCCSSTLCGLKTSNSSIFALLKYRSQNTHLTDAAKQEETTLNELVNKGITQLRFKHMWAYYTTSSASAHGGHNARHKQEWPHCLHSWCWTF